MALWVRTGRAHLRTIDGRLHRIDAGAGIWLPPGENHNVWTEPGTVAFPLRGSGRSAPDRITPFDVPRGQYEDLIDYYASVVNGDNSTREIDFPSLRSPRRRDEFGRPPTPVPHSGPAARVARQLLSAPEADHTLHDWAHWAACSASTLRRGFDQQTGMGFDEWRREHRLQVAHRALSSGRQVAEVAQSVGFTSRAGFTRAFAARFDQLPGDVRRSGPHRSAAGAPPTRKHLHTESNVMIWIRSGEAQVQWQNERSTARADDVIWVPPGARIAFGAGCRPYPLTELCVECVRLDRPRIAHFTPQWHDYLLWASLSTHTLLRDQCLAETKSRLSLPFAQHVVEMFDAQNALRRSRVVPLPSDHAARRLAQHYRSAHGLGAQGAADKVPRTIRQAFLRETGMSPAQWRRAARMQESRRLLQRGESVASIARAIGYSQTGDFSRAFRAFHGLSPSEFQELERYSPP